MRGRVAAAVAAFAVMSVLVGVHIAQADTSTVGATHDSYTTQNDPDTAHGGNAALKVNAAPAERRAYLRFTASGIPDGSTEVGAVLRLRATTTSSATFTVWSVASTWSQSTLTWNNQPPLGSMVTSRTGVTAGQYNDFNLSSLVTGDGTWAVAITSNSGSQTRFDSKEATNGTPPQLVVTWTPSGTTTTTTSGTTTTSSTTTTSTTLPSGSDPRVAAAGDIACAPPGTRTTSSCHQLAVSDLLVAGDYDAVLAVGDLQYECGQASAYQAVYDPSWGRVKAKTRPAHGDHEYTGPGCSNPGSPGYFGYFGDAATPLQPGCRSACQGWYSYQLGSWHVVVLNTDCSQPEVGGCGATSPQGRWLAADLAAHPAQCILAYWHLPRWTEPGGLSSSSSYFASALYQAHAEVVLSGNNHFYARFAPQTPAGAADPVNGIREFIVGTGGKSLHSLSSTPDPQVEARQNSTYGVLELTLHPGSYDWRFRPEAGRTFTDTGSQPCH
jgi:acid phosphatase type 7